MMMAKPADDDATEAHYLHGYVKGLIDSVEAEYELRLSGGEDDAALTATVRELQELEVRLERLANRLREERSR